MPPLANLIADALLPPPSLALFALLALLLWRRRGRLAAVLLLAPLVVLSMPIVSLTLLAGIGPPPEPPGAPPGAIVILSADVERTGEDGKTDMGALTLERVRAGAVLHRRTGAPVLVTGGVVTAPPPVAVLMAQALPSEFGVPVRWIEARSLTTWENATYSVPILKADGITRVYLVTHAWHMRRSLVAFRRAGIEAVPVVVRTDPKPRYTAMELLPRVWSWPRAYLALHEWVGLLYYTWRT